MESASSAPSACWDILSLNVHFPTDYLSYCYCMTVNLIIFIYVYLLLRFYVRIFNVSNCHCNSLSGLKGFQGLINQSINPSINQSISQSINQLTNQSLSLPPSLSPSLSPPPLSVPPRRSLWTGSGLILGARASPTSSGISIWRTIIDVDPELRQCMTYRWSFGPGNRVRDMFPVISLPHQGTGTFLLVL